MCLLFFSNKYGTTQTIIFISVLCMLGILCLHLKHKQHSTIQRRKLFNASDFSLSLNKSGHDFWTSLKPSIQCPAKLLQRIGRPGDGGKWNCGLSELELINYPDIRVHEKIIYEPCLVYSFGVSGDSSWEAEVLSTTHCAVYAYDPTVDVIGSPLKSSNNRVHFEKLGLGGNDIGNKRTLATLMKMNGHEDSLIHILKLDIEGWEYSALEKILNDFPDELPFAQLLVEFHAADWRFSIRSQIIVNILSELEKCGIRLFHLDHLGTSDYGRNLITEFSFINEKYLNLFGINQ